MFGICERCFKHGRLISHPIRYSNRPFFHQFLGRVWLNPFRMQIENSMALLQLMDNEGLLPFLEEEIKRKKTIDKLRQIVMEWSKRVAFQRRLPESYIKDASATILIYGSYGLGVHNSESDMDALCVGPCFATMAEDFFIVLKNMLASAPEVSEILCVKNARVPLMRLNFDGISIDLTYARLGIISVPENVEVLNPLFPSTMDEISWRSFSGVCANARIFQLVPNLEAYQSLLRFVKFWAKRRGIYGSVLGFFGGVHLAVLAAFICQKEPSGNLCVLVSSFFRTFAIWPWPTPVILEENVILPGQELQDNMSFENILMPIQLPGNPNKYCHSYFTRSTFNRIRAEFLHGHCLTKDILIQGFDWKLLVKPFSYERKYIRFLKICLSTSHSDELGDWVGWVKSRIRSLLVKLEEVQSFCDPNPTEYVNTEMAEPHVILYWGLCPGRSLPIRVESIKNDFMRNIFAGYGGPVGRIDLEVVKASEFPKMNTDGSSDGGSKGTRDCWRVENQRNIPVYSRYIPQYIVGYLVTDEDVEYLGAM